jgi:hypothetical protein
MTSQRLVAARQPYRSIDATGDSFGFVSLRADLQEPMFFYQRVYFCAGSRGAAETDSGCRWLILVPRAV